LKEATRIMPNNNTNFLSSGQRPFSILIAGLGNPILGDDGVGWHVAEEVSARSGVPLGDASLQYPTPENLSSLTIECYALAGISLMERFTGYDKVILIDSLNTGNYKQGKVITFTLNELEDLTHGHSASAHDASLKTALKMGRQMEIPLPNDEDVHVVAIEAKHIYDFKEELSPAIAAAVPIAVDKVLEIINKIAIG